MQLTGLYILLSLAFVGLNIDTPQDWPGLYGSILDATSMRNFWSKFNHRLVYRPLSTFTAVIIDSSLCNLPRESLAKRYALNTTVFLLSGAIHFFLEGNYARHLRCQIYNVLVLDSIVGICTRGNGTTY
jgi:hypothetical protein